MRLATSVRDMAGIRDSRNHDISQRIRMSLFPWRDDKQTKFEYRVFCPPTGKTAAISQYKWHSPWYHASLAKKELEHIASRLVEHCEVLYQQVITHPEMTDILKQRGFVFDVTENPKTQHVQLIVLNDFGALSGCGACLFHWIKDAKLLYGLEEKVEVRTAAS